MGASYQILTHKDLEQLGGMDQEFASDVLVGLSMTPKRLSSRYFYDERGSRLFQKIMELPEYYLTASDGCDPFSSFMRFSLCVHAVPG